MPNQLRFVADRAEQDDLVTVRVLPFEAGAHPGLDPFTLLQFDAGLPDTLFLDADRGAFTMITGLRDLAGGKVRPGLRGPDRGCMVRGKLNRIHAKSSRRNVIEVIPLRGGAIIPRHARRVLPDACPAPFGQHSATISYLHAIRSRI